MRVFIVEDDESMRMILKRLLRKNFPIITSFAESSSAEKALEEIPSVNPDLILVDISLPGMDGLEMIRRIKNKPNPTYILVLTGHEVEMYAKDAQKAGADDIVSKADDKQLLISVKALIEKHQFKKQ